MKKLLFLAILTVMSPLYSCGQNGNQIDELRMPLTVDYSRSIDDLVVMGNYDYANSIISDNAFTKGVQDQKDTTIIREAVLLNFNRSMSSEDVVEQMDIRGLRPATVRELFTMGHTYPRLQQEITIIALGSKTTISEVPGLLEDDFYGRGADLEIWSSNWGGNGWFLAFKK